MPDRIPLPPPDKDPEDTAGDGLFDDLPFDAIVVDGEIVVPPSLDDYLDGGS